MPVPSEQALCTTLQSSELHSSVHSWRVLGLALLGLCHMGCDRAPALLRLSLMKGSVRKVSSAFFLNGGRQLFQICRRSGGVWGLLRPLPLCLVHSGRTTRQGFASSLLVVRPSS
eukprot:scaffold296293_cov30-Tisochrysis_lutea.AAC.2